MTIEDALARLTAGLNRDEATARAAATRAAEWRAYGHGAVRGEPFFPADPEYGYDAGGETCIVYAEGFPLNAEAEHIARNDPATVLRRVEAIRKIAEISKSACAGMNSIPTDFTRARDLQHGAVGAFRDVLAILAGIYTDPEPEGANG